MKWSPRALGLKGVRRVTFNRSRLTDDFRYDAVLVADGKGDTETKIIVEEDAKNIFVYESC